MDALSHTALAMLACCLVSVASAQGRPRLVVLTDIGGDPDDQQSMVRLMVHANEFGIEGLIASASGTPGELKEAVAKPHLIREIVEAYGQVQPSLAQHAPGFPAAEELLACIKSGNPNRGVENLGEGHDTEGSQWIIAVVDRDDPRPVNVCIWGGSTELAQALWRVRNDRSADDLTMFLAKLRVHAIGDQDNTGPWIREQFPDLFYILDHSLDGDKLKSCYRGMFIGGDGSLTSREWIDTHVRTGHGPLGALYPPRTWTGPNPNSALKEGDTPSWLYFLDNGLQVPSEPNFGGWGGRFTREGSCFRDAMDTVGEETSHRATVHRWRPAFQAEFQARMDWCVKSPAEANHKPLAVCNGDASRQLLTVRAKARSTVRLSAEGSSDPDGDALGCRWWQYREAGTYAAEVAIEGQNEAQARVPIPAAARGKTVHVILEVTDDGEPPLTAYRRVIIEVTP